MFSVALDSPFEPLEGLLDPRTFRLAGTDEADIRVVGGEVADVGSLVSFVLGGGGLVICEGEDLLLSALHLLRLPDGGVSGVGYRLGPGAVGGPRGDGWVVLMADTGPFPACLAWLARKMKAERC